MIGAGAYTTCYVCCVTSLESLYCATEISVFYSVIWRFCTVVTAMRLHNMNVLYSYEQALEISVDYFQTYFVIISLNILGSNNKIY